MSLRETLKNQKTGHLKCGINVSCMQHDEIKSKIKFEIMYFI